MPLVGHGLLIVEASRSHSDTPHSVGLLWTNDQPYSGTSTSTLQRTIIIRYSYAPGRIRTCNPSKRTAGYPRLRPRGHRYSV